MRVGKIITQSYLNEISLPKNHSFLFVMWINKCYSPQLPPLILLLFPSCPFAFLFLSSTITVRSPQTTSAIVQIIKIKRLVF
jgi:hypothetical protein